MGTRSGFEVLMVAGMLSLSGLVLSEPAAEERAPVVQSERGRAEVWGDPEVNEEADSGWTWFGMGYERRRGIAGGGAGARETGDGRKSVQTPARSRVGAGK
jgi:hypothetical protein